MFTTVIKKLQQQNYSQTWQQSLKNKQVTKNSYQTYGDVKKAKAFVYMVSNYSCIPVSKVSNEKIIFSIDMVVTPAYSM